MLWGEAKVRSKKWVLIEVVAAGDATSEIGLERMSSIPSLPARNDSPAVTKVAAVDASEKKGVTLVRAVAASAAAVAVAAECLPRLSVRVAEP